MFSWTCGVVKGKNTPGAGRNDSGRAGGREREREGSEAAGKVREGRSAPTPSLFRSRCWKTRVCAPSPFMWSKSRILSARASWRTATKHRAHPKTPLNWPVRIVGWVVVDNQVFPRLDVRKSLFPGHRPRAQAFKISRMIYHKLCPILSYPILIPILSMTGPSIGSA